MGKILLFYKYVDIIYPEQIKKWQFKLCRELNLTGRIILAHEGINATLGGTNEAIDAYKNEVAHHPLFGGIDFKESPGNADHFPRLRIVVKDEIVRLGLDTKTITPKNGGKHLTPEETHALLQNKPKDLVILDGRNYFEARIGTFKDAITPNINHFREFPEYIDQNLEQFKDKEVLMFCTGGIRCERASTYLKIKGVAKEVYQVEGGIHRYIEKFPDGFFRGKNYVFDARVAVKVNDDILSNCDLCNVPYDEYTNCLNAECNKQYLGCPACIEKLNNTCSEICQELVANKKVVIRTIPKRIAGDQNAITPQSAK